MIRSLGKNSLLENKRRFVLKGGYFCYGTRRNAVPEVISQNDASRNGVPEPYFLAFV
jgi:hypothetical protein